MGIDFQPYLKSIYEDEKYRDWQDFYTPVEALSRQQITAKRPRRHLDLGLMVQTIQPPQRKGEISDRVEIERLDVLTGLRKYAANHVLLIGKPGSGKSTALEKLLWEEVHIAKEVRDISQIPVLLELRQYKTSVLNLIQEFLQRHNLCLEIAEIENLLNKQQLLLLIDGVNELPNEKARYELNSFRKKYPNIPMIFTTRDLGLGGDLGINKKLEMQPLTEGQMQQFVRAYLEDKGDEMLQRLGKNLQDFAQTPLLLWMLCEVFIQTEYIPPNLGLVFRCFAQDYNRKFWDSVQVTDEFRHWYQDLLEHLAFTMMQGKNPTDFQPIIDKREAETILTKFLEGKVDYPPSKAKDWLEELLKHHLIQFASNEQIEFRHQLIQEYYAAECLLRQIDNISPEQLKYYYLNYLKWTEPLSLMLALPEIKEKKAVEIVRLSLDVDLFLGAKLAGAVQPNYQDITVSLVEKLNIDNQLKMSLLGLTYSTSIIPIISKYLNNTNPNFRKKVIQSLERIECEAATQILQQGLKDENSDVSRTAAIILGKRGDQAAIPVLKDALEDKHFSDYFWVSYALKKISTEYLIGAIQKVIKHEDAEVRKKAIETLYPNQVNSLEGVNILTECLKDIDINVRNSAAFRLGLIDNKKAVLPLVESLLDESWLVRHTICNSLKQIDSNAAVSYITKILWDKNSNAHIKIADPYLQISNVKILQDTRSNLCQRYIEALGLLGNDNAIPTLIYSLYDENINVYSYAAIALGRIGTKPAISVLSQALENVYFGVRSITADVLSDFNNDIVITSLHKALNNEYFKLYENESIYLDVKENFKKALKKLHDKHSDNSEMLNQETMELEEHDQAIVLSLALQSKDIISFSNTIDEIEKYSYEVAIPELFKALSIEDTSMRWMASSSIGKIGNPELLSCLSKLLVRNGDEPLIAAIFGIQERCKYYNYIIATSPPPKEENNTDPLTNLINTPNQTIKTMSENTQSSKYSFPNATTVQIVENNNGEVIVHKYAAEPEQNITELETVIQKLLDEIEQNKATPIEAQLIVNQAVDNHPVLRDKQIIEQAIQNHPNLKNRLRRVATAVGIETVKVIFAPAGILIEAVKAWIQAE